MDKTKMMMMLRTEMLNNRGEGRLAFTEASNIARAKKLAINNPKNRISSETKSRGRKREEPFDVFLQSTDSKNTDS